MQNDTEERISARQATRLFLIAAAAPIIRIVPSYTAQYSKKAGAISAVISFGLCILIAMFFAKMFNDKRLKITSMENAFESAYGKIFGKVLLVIVLIMQLVIMATRLRVFTERIQTLVFTETVPILLMIVFMATAFAICKIRLKFIARFAELLEAVLVVAFSVVILICLQNFNITNIYPVTYYDIPGALHGVVAFVGIMALYSYVFYLGDSIKDKEELLKYGKSAAKIFCVTGLGLIFITTGVFGYRVVAAFSQPFFMTLKSANILGVFEGIESIFVTFWTIADYSMVIYHLIISGVLLKKIFNLESRLTMIAPVAFVTYIISFSLSKNFFMITQFTDYIILPLNIFIGLVLPMITYGVLKIKDKVKQLN